jgi:hypothetical protein
VPGLLLLAKPALLAAFGLLPQPRRTEPQRSEREFHLGLNAYRSRNTETTCLPLQISGNIVAVICGTTRDKGRHGKDSS